MEQRQVKQLSFIVVGIQYSLYTLHLNLKFVLFATKSEKNEKKTP
jgi:hypothetical protein